MSTKKPSVTAEVIKKRLYFISKGTRLEASTLSAEALEEALDATQVRSVIGHRGRRVVPNP